MDVTGVYTSPMLPLAKLPVKVNWSLGVMEDATNRILEFQWTLGLTKQSLNSNTNIIKELRYSYDKDTLSSGRR